MNSTAVAAVTARPLAATAAVLRLVQEEIAKQRGPADRCQESRHAAHRGAPLGRARRPRDAHFRSDAVIGRQMRQPRSLIIQEKCGTFDTTERFGSCPLLQEKGEAMKKTLMALGAVATLAISAVAMPVPAQAQRGVAAGVAAGLIGGAIVGGAIASQNGYYGPGYYAPGPAYVAGPGPDCYWQRQRFWDGYGWRIRNVQVCN